MTRLGGSHLTCVKLFGAFASEATEEAVLTFQVTLLSPLSPGARQSTGGKSYAAVQPPSIARLAPVICAASSLHRKSASEATCSTVTNSLVGWAASRTSLMTSSLLMLRVTIVFGICFSTSGVQTYPGLMQLQVILDRASSSATVLVSPTMPCLAAT